MTRRELPPGLYEALLTARMVELLPEDNARAITGAVDPADAPIVLAHHLARVLEVALKAPGWHDDLKRQVALTNELIQAIASGDQRLHDLIDEAVGQDAKQLLEILHPGRWPLGQVQRSPRPTIPLTQDALLVAAKQEPVLAAELRQELDSADSVDLLCAFVRWSGIRVLLDPLRRLVERSVRIRVITTTYTGSTELRALEELQRLGAEIKVSYEVGSTRLHAKAWLFERQSGYSTAYIGSSNLSHTALHDGLEWNVRLTQAASPALLQRFRAAFETYWADPEFEPFQPDVFANALDRGRRTEELGLIPFDIQPHPFQSEMLYQLEVERERHGHWHNLVVAATGTGKTVVSAFDYSRVCKAWGGKASLLFVAHREEILRQSRAMFCNVLRDGSFGELMVGGQRPAEGHHVFASIQSLSRVPLEQLRPDAYDVVIVDEFHHAEAPTYARLIEHLKPRLLLGLTATPERADGLDIKRWFDGRIAVELRLWDALDQGLLAPFQYFGVADGTDLSALSWHRGGYDLGELEGLYTANDFRVTKVLRAVHDIVETPGRMTALGFCVSIAHAEYMAHKFREAGIPSQAVSANSSREERAAALRDLRAGRLNALFAVDLFNEGLDIPDIDTVMFLRPTESPVVFLQQLGRGLRRAPGKSGLTVLDFIGQQHRRFRFEDRFRALLGGDRKTIVSQVVDGFPYLPAGCSITLDRQSTETVLANIKASIPNRRAWYSERLRDLGDIPLVEYLDRSMVPLEDVYSGSTPGWTTIRRGAGFIAQAEPNEARLGQWFARMLHVDDPERVAVYRRWLQGPAPPAPAQLSERERRLLTMLHFDLWPAVQQTSNEERTTLAESMRRLWLNPGCRGELVELLAILGARSRHMAPDPGLEPEIPLRLHTRYTRQELLAALGEVSAEQPRAWREGVRRVEHYGMDVFLVTLVKSEQRFSPSTRYRDYPISPNLFHWESQSTTSVASPTGQRYVTHTQTGDRILLCVRESPSAIEGLGAAPFLLLGTARYVRHEGDRPMAITWSLDHSMPPDFFQAAKAAV